MKLKTRSRKILVGNEQPTDPVITIINIYSPCLCVECFL